MACHALFSPSPGQTSTIKIAAHYSPANPMSSAFAKLFHKIHYTYKL